VNTINFDEIRARHPLPEYCERRGIKLRRSGGSFVGKCPLHNEHHGEAFVVFDDGHWRCFGKCQKSGDVTDLEQALGGGTRAEAAARLGAERTQSIRPLPKAEPEPVKPIYELTKADRGLMAEATVALRRKPELALRVRENLPLEAVEQTAIEGDLGFCHELSFAGISGPALLFCYSHGIKARWPGKVIRWICGNAASECWRQSLLLKSHHVVYFTEGEPDALSLIAQGYDVPGDSLVVGLASADTLPNSEPFAGKDLVLIPDTDDAGRRCAERFRTIFSPVARSVAVVDLIQSEGL
jgi:DNA primase